MGLPAHQQGDSHSTHAAAPAGCCERSCCIHEDGAATVGDIGGGGGGAAAAKDSTVTAAAAATDRTFTATAGRPGGHAQSAVTAEVPACSYCEPCSPDEAVQGPQMVPCQQTGLLTDQHPLQPVSSHSSSSLALPAAAASHLQCEASSLGESVTATCGAAQCMGSLDGVLHPQAQAAITNQHVAVCAAMTKARALAVVESPCGVTATALPTNPHSAKGAVVAVTKLAAVAADSDTRAATCLDSSSASSRLLHLSSQVCPVKQTATWALSPSTPAAAAASEVRHKPQTVGHSGVGQADDQAFINSLRRSDSASGSTVRGAADEVAGCSSRGVGDVGAWRPPQTEHPPSCIRCG